MLLELMMARKYEDNWIWSVEYTFNKNVMHTTETPRQASYKIPTLLGLFFNLIYEFEHAGRVEKIVIKKIHNHQVEEFLVNVKKEQEAD